MLSCSFHSSALLLLFVAFSASPTRSQACLGTPDEFKMEFEDILGGGGGGTGLTVCPERLYARTDVLWPGQENYPTSLSQYGNMWAFVSDGDALDQYLYFARQECITGLCDRRALIIQMMTYAGFGVSDIEYELNRGKSFVMVVVNQTETQDAWPDYGPFQVTWEETYKYLGQSTGFEVCNIVARDGEEKCQRKTMPGENKFANTIGSMGNYPFLTGCDSGFSGTIRAICPAEYELMKTEYEAARCNDDGTNLPCGSGRCVDIYTEGAAGYGADTLELAQWTRAFFEMCMGMNPWFTGLGLGYNPTTGKTTAAEFLVRGDEDVPSNGLGARYIELWTGNGLY